ncbi:hypothetical protein BDC45DRAFT_500878 [Circinella umbellata]|nr:hypothetical protein BDC45DRAFT_500878 [Circinella umbellata]
MGKAFSIDNSHIKHDKYFNNSHNIKQQSDTPSPSLGESSSYRTTPASSPLTTTDNNSTNNIVDIDNDNKRYSLLQEKQRLPEFHISQPNTSTDDSPALRSLSEGSIKLCTDSASPHVQDQSTIRISQSTSALPFFGSAKRKDRRRKLSLTFNGISSVSNNIAASILPQQQEQQGQQRHQFHKKMSGISSLKSAFSSIYSNSDEGDSETVSSTTKKDKSKNKKKRNKKLLDIHHTTTDNTLSASSSPELIPPSCVENHPRNSPDLSLNSVSTDRSSVARNSTDDFPIGNKLDLVDDKHSIHSDISALCQALKSIDQVRGIPDSDTFIGNRRHSSSAPDLYHLKDVDEETERDLEYQQCCGKLGFEIGLNYDGEMDYQQRKHFLLKRIWGSIYQAKIRDPKLIVNWMSSTGNWEREMAKEFPNAKIIGLDYKPITLSTNQGNITFHQLEVKSYCQSGIHGLEKFDENTVDFLVLHEVWIIGSHMDQWARVLNQAFRILRPNGWLEIYNNECPIVSGGPAMDQVEHWMSFTKEKFGINPKQLSNMTDMLKDIGFKNISSKAVELPVGEWGLAPVLKETGYWIKDLRRRRLMIRAPGIKHVNHLSDSQFKEMLKKALDDCEYYRAHTTTECVIAQKPTLSLSASAQS